MIAPLLAPWQIADCTVALALISVGGSKVITVCEVGLLPGEDAVLAPDWLPWSERLAPGHVGQGMEDPVGPLVLQ